MKEAIWGYFLIGLGIVVIVILMLFQDVTTTNDQNYYLLKEVTEAAMLESVDLAYYRNTGEVTINDEKFVENFIRRFSESAGLNKNYKIKFYDIVESPPKVSLSVGSKSNVFTLTGEQFDITNKIDAILETTD